MTKKTNASTEIVFDAAKMGDWITITNATVEPYTIWARCSNGLENKMASPTMEDKLTDAKGNAKIMIKSHKKTLKAYKRALRLLKKDPRSAKLIQALKDVGQL